MSQNGPHSGPPWSHGSSDEPYAEPADPWGDQGAAVPPDPSWGGHPPSIPQQPLSYQSSAMWGQSAPPPPPKRNTPIVVLVVTLGVLVCIGLGAAAWLWKAERDADRVPQRVGRGDQPRPGAGGQ